MTSDREIKFRGKRLDNGEWVYGDLLHGRGGLTWIVVDAYKTLYEADGILAPNNEQNLFRVDPKSVGQYIGHRDKSGLEVYAGDIVEWELSPQYPSHGTAKMAIEWQNDNQCWVPHVNSTSKVLGSIHDNPELLEGQHE